MLPLNWLEIVIELPFKAKVNNPLLEVIPLIVIGNGWFTVMVGPLLKMAVEAFCVPGVPADQGPPTQLPTAPPSQVDV